MVSHICYSDFSLFKKFVLGMMFLLKNYESYYHVFMCQTLSSVFCPHTLHLGLNEIQMTKFQSSAIIVNYCSISHAFVLFLKDGNEVVSASRQLNFYFFLRFFLFFERGKGGERGRETSMCKRYMDWLLLMHPTGDLAYNPGMCPGWESNQ